MREKATPKKFEKGWVGLFSRGAFALELFIGAVEVGIVFESHHRGNFGGAYVFGKQGLCKTDALHRDVLHNSDFHLLGKEVG